MKTANFTPDLSQTVATLGAALGAMHWLLKKLGYRDRQFPGSDFSVRIEPMGREAVYVIHTRQGTSLNLDGQRIGRK